VTDYPFDMQLVVDPNHPENVVRDAAVTIFDAADTAGTTPLTLTSPAGLPILNPLISNPNGFLQPFIASVPQVMWKSGVFQGFFNSYVGMRNEAIAAKDAAATSAAAAAQSALNAQAPTDAQVDAAVDRADIPAQVQAATTTAVAGKLDTATAVTTYGDFQTALAKWTPRITASKVQADKLTDWFTALGTGKAQMLAIGDSITEGTGASTMALRWQTILQALLREYKGSLVGATFPYIAANPVTSVTGKPVVLAGTITRSNTFGGISGRSSNMSAGATETFTFTGDQFKVLYFMGSTTAFMNIVIDGGAPTIFDTNSTRLAVPGNAAAVWTSPMLTLGTHTVVISRDASTPVGTNTVVLGGMVTYSQDQSTGIRILDGGYHGANSGTGIDWNHTGKNTVAAGGADLVAIAFGMNDVPTNGVGGTGSAQFKTNINSIISKLRAEGLTKSYLLIGMYQGNSKYTADWTPYMTALSEIAAGDSKIAFLNLGLHMPAPPNPYNLAGGLGLYADGLHPSDNGHSWMAQTIVSALKA
jgi:lysophospholipase L1-like esterase